MRAILGSVGYVLVVWWCAFSVFSGFVFEPASRPSNDFEQFVRFSIGLALLFMLWLKPNKDK